MSLVHKRVLVLYAIPGLPLWHERLVAAHICDDSYVVYTPDADMYEEDLSPLSVDLAAVAVRNANGLLPAGVPPARVYPLPLLTAAQRMQILDDGEAMAAGLRPVAAAPAAGPVAGAGVAAGAAVGIGGLSWRAAETHGGISYGEAVPGVVDVPVEGAKVVHVLADGAKIFVEAVADDKVADFLMKPALLDMRILPLISNSLGTPERTLASAVASCSEDAVAWQLSGPRTVKWCLNYLLIEGRGFDGHHDHLKALCRLEGGSWGIQEHLQLSQCAKQAVLIDQLDVCNLLAFEIIFRRLQTIEFAHSERAKEHEAKHFGGRLSMEEQSAFGGVTRAGSALMLCPLLLDHVRAEIEKDASLAKNLRKAREEREALAKSHAGGKKGKKGGDGDKEP